MENIESQYIDLIKRILYNCNVEESRNGVMFTTRPHTLVWDYREGLPVFTHRKIFVKTAVVETSWITKGMDNIDYLHKYGVKIWDQFADENGNVPLSYGPQLRNFNGFDQLAYILDNLQESSRRLVVSYWNPSEPLQKELPPCHYTWQLIPNKDKFDMVVSLRSSDVLVGLPYDILHYAILFVSLCKAAFKNPGAIYFNINLPHIYQEQSYKAITVVNRKLGDFTHSYYIPSMALDGINVEDVDIDYEPINESIKLKAIL